MKRSILICSVCFTMAGLYAGAQNKKSTKPPPPPVPPIEALIVPPPPPPPPPPPLPMIDKMETLPLPVVPALLPVLPVPSSAERNENWVSRTIINGNGYEISIQKNNNDGMVYIRKNGDTQKIKLSTWNANKKYYEKKYGMLPPPPPPLPVN